MGPPAQVRALKGPGTRDSSHSSSNETEQEVSSQVILIKEATSSVSLLALSYFSSCLTINTSLTYIPTISALWTFFSDLEYNYGM